MTKDEIYECWAPAEGRWSRWVRPVLFAQLDEGRAPAPPSSLPESVRREVVGAIQSLGAVADGHAYRQAGRSTDLAVVIDLPGAVGVLVAASVAPLGLRPVPLYNAVPASHAVVDMEPIVDALVAAAATLDGLPADAPPAFVLDARRRGDASLLVAGRFDNRSICNEADFPSPKTLWDAGVRRVVLIQDGDGFASDLLRTLLAWQEQGIRLFFKRADSPGACAPVTVAPPSWLQRVEEWIQRRSLRPRGDGEYGELVPEAGSS